jgi:hypothetical protein
VKVDKVMRVMVIMIVLFVVVTSSTIALDDFYGVAGKGRLVAIAVVVIMLFSSVFYLSNEIMNF